MIKLTITKYENNDRFEAELAEYKDNAKFGNMRTDSIHYPKREISREILDVFITEEQFEAIRKQ